MSTSTPGESTRMTSSLKSRQRSRGHWSSTPTAASTLTTSTSLWRFEANALTKSDKELIRSKWRFITTVRKLLLRLLGSKLTWLGVVGVSYPDVVSWCCVGILILDVFSPHPLSCDNRIGMRSLRLGSSMSINRLGRDLVHVAWSRCVSDNVLYVVWVLFPAPLKLKYFYWCKNNKLHQFPIINEKLPVLISSSFLSTYLPHCFRSL